MDTDQYIRDNTTLEKLEKLILHSKNKINNLTQKQEVSFHFFPFQKTSCDISAGLKETTLKRKEKEMDNYRKTFISPTVAISFVHTDITKSWSAAYRLHNFAPNIVQLRPQIDNSNPYMLRSGNPNLKTIISTFVPLQLQSYVRKT